MYSVAAPFTHGSSGSDVIASNCLPAGQQEVARVVDADANLRVVDDVVVLFAEVGGDDARDERLDFGDGHALDHRIDADRARRDAGAAADHEHRARMVGDERRQMSEHPLQPHVFGRARRLNLAGVVVAERAVRQPGHRD